jgi:aspartate racemase
MQSSYYQNVFSRYGISIIVPDQDDQSYIHKVIMTELVYGKILDETRKALPLIAQKMIEKDSIEGLILGCTELPLILTKDEFGIPFLNTTKIHAESAVRYCLSET